MIWRVALYIRLSREDGNAESESVVNQKKILMEFLEQHFEGQYIFVDFFVDDGLNGTDDSRRDFMRMITDIEDDNVNCVIEDIEEGRVSAVICKDLSRLGRNNAMVAYFTEIVFPSRDIRFIAVNDSIDSAIGENEIMGFKSIINEFYARDISKKIKSSKHTRALAGEFTGYLAPLGYRKDPDDKHRLLVEEDGAAIVRHIFKLAVEGLGTTQIAHRLNEDGVPTPREHFNGKDGTAYQTSQPMYTPKWTPASVRYILRNRAYLGNEINPPHLRRM